MKNGVLGALRRQVAHGLSSRAAENGCPTDDRLRIFRSGGSQAELAQLLFCLGGERV
jgi:hypothetical protein